MHLKYPSGVPVIDIKLHVYLCRVICRMQMREHPGKPVSDFRPAILAATSALNGSIGFMRKRFARKWRGKQTFLRHPCHSWRSDREPRRKA
jgi:hypothetical protein